MLSVIVSGIVMGLLYALAGQGLVVVYRTTKVLNFALGGMGIAVGYLAFEMLGSGVPYWIVLPVAVMAGAVLGGLVERLVVRPLHQRPHLTISIATMGVLLILEGLAGMIWGVRPTALPPFLGSAGTLRLGDALAINANRMFIIFVGIAATVGLIYLIDKTKLGLGMRATTSGPMTAQLMGVDVEKVRVAGWVIGGAYGGLAALLVTPLTYLSPTSFTTFLLTAFAAVVLGGFTSIIGVVLGAIAFGIGTNLLVVYVEGGMIATYTLIGAAILLVFRPHGIFGRNEREISEPAIARRSLTAGQQRSVAVAHHLTGHPDLARRRAIRSKGLTWCGIAALLAVVPFALPTTEIYLVATILATFVGVLGLNIVTGYSGQVSLGNSGFAAAGAYTAAIAAEQGVPFLVALALAAAAGALVGLVIGLVATRLEGVYLALLTLLFAFATPEIITYFRDITGGIDGKSMVSADFATPESQYWLVYAVAMVAAVGVLIAAETRLGRNWRAVRDSEDGARALGLNPARVKLGAFVLSSSLVGVGGALVGLLTFFIGPESFGVFLGIYALLAVVLGGTGSVLGSLIGSAFIVWMPKHAGDLPIPLVFGVALLAVILVAPTGVAGLVESGSRWVTDRVRSRPSAPPAGDRSDQVVAEDRRIEPDAGGQLVDVTDPVLALERVTAGYGTGSVLRGLSLTVGKGEVVTLLGANGAGKSTVLRVISGLIPVDEGEVRWLGDPVGGRALKHPYAIARSGIAHVPEGRGIFPDLTVEENLRMGRFARADQHGYDEDLERVFGHFPKLRERSGQLAGTLSGGEQQMLAIGRALVGRPKLLMLDEPSLGLSPLMSQLVFDNLKQIAKETDVSVLLIEQNARAALELADRGYVLARGRIVAAGTAEELGANKRLSDLYLAVH